MPDRIKHIMVVDDHSIFVSGLKALLTSIYEVAEIVTFTNPLTALSHLSSAPIDLVITDISMPQMDGITFINSVRKLQPDKKILVLSMHAEPAIIKRIIKGNPNGFLLKNTETVELQRAIESICNGENYYAREIHNILIADLQGTLNPPTSILPNLSSREREVLMHVSNELTTQEIADKMFLSANTIETYRQNLFKKLKVKNAAGLVSQAYQLGLL